MVSIIKKIRSNERVLIYILVGIFAFSSEYFSFIFVFYLVPASYSLLIAQTISFSLGLIVSFNGNRLLTFKGNKNNYKYNKKQQLGLYLLVALLNLLLSNFVIFILINWLYILPLISKLIVMTMVVFWNFYILNRLIFNSKQ